MAKQNDLNTIAGVSNESVLKATENSWSEWFAYLDEHKAEKLSHKDIVKVLSKKLHKPWWCQKIANGYEQHKGLRTLGETANAGFQVGVSKTIDLDKNSLWDIISSPEGMKIWLGEIKDSKAYEGESFETRDGIKGQITVLKSGSHFRISWQPKHWKQKSVLQVRVIPKNQKSILSFHQEGLPNVEERENMKNQWTEKISQLLELINK